MYFFYWLTWQSMVYTIQYVEVPMVQLGKPLTRSFKTNLFKILMLRWESVWYQIQLSLEEAFDSKQTKGTPTIGFMSKVNMSPFSFWL